MRPLPTLDLSTTIIPVIDVGAAVGGGGDGTYTLVATAAAAAIACPTGAQQFRSTEVDVMAAGAASVITSIPLGSVFRLELLAHTGQLGGEYGEWQLMLAGTATVVAFLGKFNTGNYGPYPIRTDFMTFGAALDLVYVKTGGVGTHFASAGIYVRSV